jgi:hypothetical protein
VEDASTDRRSSRDKIITSAGFGFIGSLVIEAAAVGRASVKTPEAAFVRCIFSLLYAPHPIVLIRLAKITRAELKELLRDASRFVSSSSPKSRK